MQRNQLLASPGPTGRGGVIKNFIKRNTPTRPDLKVCRSPSFPLVGREGIKFGGAAGGTVWLEKHKRIPSSACCHGSVQVLVANWPHNSTSASPGKGNWLVLPCIACPHTLLLAGGLYHQSSNLPRMQRNLSCSICSQQKHFIFWDC